uniref:hypothetical protein n=1 Tax=Pararhizobium sp. IMCC3301 TaxID=3067904 RepID=UPI002741AC87|nr:hypothetical protein [Pararhizobium sp. IMCC3301]
MSRMTTCFDINGTNSGGRFAPGLRLCPLGPRTPDVAEHYQGHAKKAVAKNLSISVRTMESHRLSIREKSGDSNTARPTRIAGKLKLI